MTPAARKRPGKDDQPDIVDQHIRDWLREFPSMDAETEGLVERIAKLARYLERSLGETARAFGLTIQDWELLGALRRAGPPYRLSPSKLAQDLLLSGGAMTARLDRLESAGLVRRRPDPDDRRAVRVELTEKGSKTWGTAVDVQAAKERMVAAALSDREKEVVNASLRRLMRTFEETEGPPPRRAEVLEAYAQGRETKPGRSPRRTREPGRRVRRPGRIGRGATRRGGS